MSVSILSRFGRQHCRNWPSPCRTCNRLILVTVLLALGSTVIWAQSSVGQPRDYWYEPPCLSHNFSWTTRNNGIQQCQSKLTEESEQVSASGLQYCHNPLDPITDESERPPPVQNIQVHYYKAEFKYSNQAFALWGGHYSAINVTFNLGLQAAGKVTGVLFSRRSVSIDSDDYTDPIACRLYNFGEALQVDALLDQNNNSLKLNFDCFRGQKPGMEYEITIRTLPVRTTDGLDPNDTVTKILYRSPSCYSVPDDHLCKTPTKERLRAVELCAHWKPQYFIVDTTFRNLSIAMELGPVECGFNWFKLVVLPASRASSGDSLWTGEGVVDINVASMGHVNTVMYNRTITYISLPVNNVSEGRRVILVTPSPAPNTCFNSQGGHRPCAVVYSRVIAIRENPCLRRSNVCNTLEVCVLVGRRGFVCQCKNGFTRNNRNHRCEATNPCLLDPCGNGTCHYDYQYRHNTPYRCQCNAGFTPRNNTCQVDHCYVNYQSLNDNNNPCGHHGECHHLATSEFIVADGDYYCVCNLGYYYDKDHKSCLMSVPVLIAVIISSLVIASLLLAALFAWRRCQITGGFMNLIRRSSDNDEMIPNESEPTTTEEVTEEATAYTKSFQQGVNKKQEDVSLKIIQVVILSTDDHPLHEDVIDKFARFLMSDWSCDVRLAMWYRKDIALRGTAEWLTHTIQWADKVIIICSKGARLSWQSHCDLRGSDAFAQATSYILRDVTATVGPSDKYCVAYFDYTAREAIPPPLNGGAVYCLMKHADSLFFRLHDIAANSPRTDRRVRHLEGNRYAEASPQGKTLYDALVRMKMFQVKEPEWFERFNGSCCDNLDDDDDESATTTSIVPLIFDGSTDRLVNEIEKESIITTTGI